MNKKIRIYEYSYLNVYTITIDNARLCFDKINHTIKYFSNDTDFFFGHYKKDGINLTNSEMSKYETEIPTFFKTNGRFCQIEEKNIKHHYSELTVCSTTNNIEIYSFFEKIFNYYLETIIFCPKIDWETFIEVFKNYTKTGAYNFITNEYTDFLFSYVDSGDFSISFNPKKYDCNIIRKKIHEIWQGNTGGRQGTVRNH